VRRIGPASTARPFLQTTTAKALVEERLLVPYAPLTDDEHQLERIGFVSSPFEWCDAQLKAAAELTLQLSSRILPAGHELKDASAWNIIFDGCTPLFCDHLSFQPIQSRQWWAFGQFLRHFLLPLQVSGKTGLVTSRLFRMSRDGLQAAEARRILGLRIMTSRLWPLIFMRLDSPPPSVSAAAMAPKSRSLHENLYGYCSWVLAGQDRGHRRTSVWSDYTETRSHYKPDAQQAKLQVVAGWLDSAAPQRVVDVGANTGEFVDLAVSKGCTVIAIEQDHESLTRLYKAAAGGRRVHPVLCNLGDVCGGSGWLGAEHSGLMSRLQSQGDMVLLLAVIHHLAISESIPLDMIADFAASVTKDYAVVEFIGESDPMLGRLAAQRHRNVAEFSRPMQEEAFQRRFDFVARHELADTGRCLVLMRRRPS
jgi:hypothetical protein